MNTVWALVPVKFPAHAKSRLAPALSQAERIVLAEHMTRDVLAALRACHGIEGVALLTAGSDARELAQQFDCRILPDDTRLDLSGNLQAAAATLATEGARSLVIVPTDLPTLTVTDIESLLAGLGSGVTVVPAGMDGGTNALGMAPPTAGECLFGPDSARRHLDAARRRGVEARLLELPAFARDVDTVDDVRWLCDQGGSSSARAYLDRSGICARLRQLDHQRMT